MKIKLLAILGVAAFAVAVISQAQDEKPPGVLAIQAVYPNAYFVGPVGSKDGQTLFWRFRMPAVSKGCYVFVTVPSYTVPKSFDAHYTVALSAVDYYKDELAGRPLPSGGEDIPYPPANLTEIMQSFPGVKFLGQFANGNYSGLRWAFLFPADHDHPDVVINVSPKETAEEMITAFWTGLDAIRCYQQVGEVPPQNSDKTTFQNLNPDGTVPNPANI